MARTSVMLTNFTGGEQTPKLRGRIDLAKYANGCTTLQNFMVLPQGGAERRHGTEYIASAKYSTRKALLLRFEFSITQAYILEFGHYYMRVYMDGGQVVSGSTPYEIVTPYAETQLAALSFAQSADVLYIAHPSFAPRQLSRTGHTSWTLSLFDWKNGPFFDENTGSTTFMLTSIGGSTGFANESVYITASAATFVSTDVGRWVKFRYTSPAEVITDSSHEGGTDVTSGTTVCTPIGSTGQYQCVTATNVNPNSTVCQFQPSLAAGWTWLCSEDVTTPGTDPDDYTWNGTEWSVNGPWVLEYRFEEDTGDVQLQYSLDNGVNWDLYENLSGANFDWATVEGDLNKDDYGGVTPRLRLFAIGSTAEFFYKFRLLRDERLGYMKITSYISTTKVAALVMSDVTHLNRANRLWSLGSWSGTSGWPSVVTFHQDRLFFASTPTEPQTVWSSKTGDYNNFESGDDDDNALNFSLVANDVNYIQWMVSRGDLVLGGASGEWVLKSYNGPLTPTNIQVQRVSTYGSESAGGELTDNALVYIQRGGKRVRLFAYDYNTDSYQSSDMNLFADHITDGTSIVDVDFMNSPDPLLWCVKGDGTVGILTLMTDQQVIAWSSFITDGLVESVATLSGEVWLYINRTIGGTAKRYIERLTWWDGTIANASFVDSSLSYSGSAVTSVSGMDHLIGETVAIFNDGVYAGTAVVGADGSVALPASATVITVGLPYTSILVTNPLEIPNNTNTSQSYTKRIVRAVARLFKTVGGVLGRDSSKTYALVSGDDMFTGDKELLFPNGYDKDATVYIAQSDPLPMTITAIIAEGESMER